LTGNVVVENAKRQEEPKTPQRIPQGISQGKRQKIAEPEIDVGRE